MAISRVYSEAVIMDHIAAKPPKWDEAKRAPVVDSWLVDLAKWLYDEVEKQIPSKPPSTSGSEKQPAPDMKPSKPGDNSGSQKKPVVPERTPVGPKRDSAVPQRDSAGNKASESITKMGETCPRPNLKLEIPNLFPER